MSQALNASITDVLMEQDWDMVKNRRGGNSNGQETLAASGNRESRYQAFFDAVPSAVFVCDCAGVIQDYNARAAELWGREPKRGDPRERYCGSWKIYHPSGQPWPHTESPAAVVIGTGERISNVKAVIERPDNSRITVRMNVAPLCDPVDEITGAIISFDDISEFERVQEELRESDDRYRHLVETSPYGIGVHRNGQLLYCNAHALQILRARSFEEVMGRSMFEFIHPEDRAKVAKRVQSIVADGAAVAPVVIRLLALDRTEVAVEAIGRSVLFQGQPAVQTVLREVTEAQQALSSLAASEERFRTLAEQATDGIFLADDQGRYIDVNTAGCEMLGYTRQEICRLTIQDIIAPVEIQRVKPALRSLHEGYPVRSEWHFRRKDGSIFDGEVSAKTLPDSRVLACLRDITERKRAEESLREAEGRFRTLLEDLERVAVQAYEPDGTITFWNKASERFYGYPAAHAVGQDVVQLLHGEQTRDEERRIMAEALRTGDLPPAQEVEVRRQDGSTISIFASRILHARPGKPPEFVCFDVDTTDLKRAEKELALRQAKWLHAARLSTVGEMVAALTHEVSQPLSSIGNFAAACSSMLDSGRKIHRTMLQEYIQQVTKQVHRCGAILQRLRDFSRRGTVHRSPCDLNQVLRESCALMSNDLRGHDVTIDFELAPTLPPISCDRIQIEQVVVNLLTNARDAMRDQPHDRRCMIIRSKLEGDLIAFEVADRGIGLSEQVSRSLFEPFFTTKVTGMGIGLSISKTIIADHGGQIEGYVNEDGGATFCVRLPISQAQA
jgi:PAS domain S-box-containing protein